MTLLHCHCVRWRLSCLLKMHMNHLNHFYNLMLRLSGSFKFWTGWLVERICWLFMWKFIGMICSGSMTCKFIIDAVEFFGIKFFTLFNLSCLWCLMLICVFFYFLFLSLPLLYWSRYDFGHGFVSYFWTVLSCWLPVLMTPWDFTKALTSCPYESLLTYNSYYCHSAVYSPW